MIPKTIHYCWFGQGEMPQLAVDCIASWHRYMPDWEYQLWCEDNFDINSNFYIREAYESGKYAFVSDYVRLWALERNGGLYFDVDFEVYKPFDDLLQYHAFAGFESSKYLPVMMGVCASEPHGIWVREMLSVYEDMHFLRPDGKPDITTSVQRLTALMVAGGLCQDGTEQDYKDLHVFPVDYFSPRHTTGEYVRTENTYCEHKGLGSWDTTSDGWKRCLLNVIGQRNMTRLIKLKRHLENINQT